MAKKKRKRISIALDPEDLELLRRDFGDAGKGVRELISRYRHTLGPKSPIEREAWHALLSRSEATDGVIPWNDAVATVMQLGYSRDSATKIIQNLFSEGYMDRLEDNKVRILRKRIDLGGLMSPWMPG